MSAPSEPVDHMSPDPPGPLVAVCLGPRCAGVRQLAGDADGLAELRGAVRRSRGAVLVTTGCLGPCASGAVVAVGRRAVEPPRQPGGATTLRFTGRVAVFGCVERGAAAAALAEWVSQGGPVHGEPPRLLAPSLVA